jgi:hypothetical protein
VVDLAEKPTIESIKQMVKHFDDIWREAHGIFHTVDTYYERTFDLWEKGANRPNLHPMKPRSIIDTALDQLMGHEAQTHRFGEDEGKAQERDQVEKAMNAIFRQAALQEVSLSFKQAGKNLLLYGYSVIEDSIDGLTLSIAESDKPEKEGGEGDDEFKQRIRLWEHKKKSAMPFRIRAPHPATVLMDPMRKEPRVAIKIGQWTAQDLVDITKLKKEQQRGDVELFEPMTNPFQLITAFEYWTEDWHALLTAGVARTGGVFGFGGTAPVPGQLLVVDPNTWGFVPFSHTFSGWGQEPSERSTMNPKYLAVGMIQHAMDDLRMDAQAIAGRHNALIDATFAKTGTTEETSELEEQMATSDIINLPGESAMWTIKAPNLPRWLETLENSIDKDLEEGTYTRSLGGIRDVGVSTVGQQAILNTAGHRKFVPINTQMQGLGTKSFEHILQWIDVLDLDLTIEGHNIKRSMIGGDYTGKVTFQVADPVLQLQERQQALNEWKAGAMALATFWSVSGREDAAGERDRLAEDQVYAHPQVNEMFVEAAAERLGLLRAFRDDSKTPGPGADAVESGQSTILGPDGRPMETTLQGGTGQTGEQLRQPITGQVARPSRTGQNLAG